jgi:putative nucleotidyltransferase with HDIG domain
MPLAVNEVLDHLSGLPPFPKVTIKLLAMLEDDTISVDDLSRIISADPSLVLKVLHLANSPFYMVSKPVESVKEAVMVLGINTIKSITTAASVQKGLAAVKPRTDAFDMLGFWRHSYATAISANKLGRQSDPMIADTLYVAGLIHDIGKVIMAYYWPEVWKGIVNSLQVSSESFLEVEQRLFHWSHTQIGAQLCRNWQFPDKIVSLVEHHHDTNTPTTPSHLRLLLLAHCLSNHSGFGFPANGDFGPCYSEEYPELKSIADGLPGDVEYQLRVLES